MKVARERARWRGQPCTIDRDFIYQRLMNGRCEATDIEFELLFPNHPFAPTLDRKCSDFGYTPHNTQVVIAAYNFAKGSWGDGPVELMAIEMCKRRGLL